MASLREIKRCSHFEVVSSVLSLKRAKFERIRPSGCVMARVFSFMSLFVYLDRQQTA